MSLSKSKVDWENLLPELLAVIAKRLTSTWDYTSFRGVCKSWRSAATFNNFDHAFSRVPWLMFIGRKRDWQKGSPPVYEYVTKFLDLSRNKKTFRIANVRKVDEKLINYYLCCRGWLLGVAESSVHAYLTHPIRGLRIKLPNLGSFPGYTTTRHFLFFPFIKKMVLSGRRKIVYDLVIAVIWGRKKQLGFSRPGDSSWTLMEPWDGSFTDILYHNEKLYAIDDKLRVVECDIRGPNPTRMQQILSIQDFYSVVYLHGDCYMAESSGKFIIVAAYRFLFQVFEFDLMNGTHKEIDDLGNRTLFLSENSSSLCLGQDFAWNDEVKPNCVYLADQNGVCIHVRKGYSKRSIGPEFYRVPVHFPTWVVPDFLF